MACCTETADRPEPSAERDERERVRRPRQRRNQAPAVRAGVVREHGAHRIDVADPARDVERALERCGRRVV